MKFFRVPALLLAAALQLLPMCRTVCTAPAFSSTLAIIFRWTIGATATVGAFDTVSGGSVVYFDCPRTAVGTVGVPFVYYMTLGGTIGTDGGSVVAASPLPGGFTNYWVAHLSSPTSEWGVISGTPTNSFTNMLINLTATNPHYLDGNSAPIVVNGSLYLTVYPSSTPVVITTQPTNVIANNGQSVSFTVAATGTGPLTYQWFKKDTNIWYHIQSATNNSYTFNATTNSSSGSWPINQGNYLVRVAGAAGMVSSSVASLIVNSPQLNITAPPTNLTVNVGAPANFYVTAGGTTTLGYQWYRNATNRLSGATASSYSLASAQSTNNGDFFAVVVTNASGALTSSIAMLTVNSGAVLPSITTQPTNLTVVAGQPATLVVGATGTAPLKYQWWRSSTNVSSAATNSSLVFTNARLSDAGTYSVTVSNSAGGLVSSNAVLTVTVPSAPTIAASGMSGNKFYFTFTPVVGLTNSVLTNSSVVGSWGVLTNIPPPPSASSITITDTISGSLKFYRASFTP